MTRFILLALFAVGASCFYIDNEPLSKDKIVNGEYVTVDTVPYFAQVIVGGLYMCGAAIISPHWLISAAHCFFDRDLKIPRISIIIGSSDRALGESHKVSRIILHGKYNDLNMDNDISLIKVKVAIRFNELQKPIGISKVPPTVGQNVIFSGFGDQASGENSPPHLKVGYANIIDHHLCWSHFQKEDSQVTENMFCAYSSKDDTCQGDSGGPVVHGNVLVGVVSWGIGCREGHPGVYAQVSNYVHWIKANTGFA